MAFNLNFLIFILFSLPAYFAIAQTGNQVVYVSQDDESLTLSSLAVATVYDNINGIYSKPIEKFLKELVASDKNWALSELQDTEKIKFSTIEPEVFEDTPAQVQSALSTCACRGLLVSRISKGPNGLNARLTLLTGPKGLPLIQETFQDLKLFELQQLREKFADMYAEIKRKLPYRGLIRSRRGNDVTIDLGSRNGLSEGTEISVAQILKINRHPKHKFMISAEKEIIGKIQITKVEDFLSFGVIHFEKEPGVLRVGGKILPHDFINYPMSILTPDGAIADLATRKDRNISFGKDPKEWVPVSPPQYGKIGILAGLGTYSQSSSLVGGGSAEGRTSLAPQLAVSGEFWYSPNWIIQGEVKQSIFQISNTLQNSDPSKVDMSVSEYSMAVGYNFLLLEDFFGPKIQVFGGYDSHSYNAGSTSPTAFTKMSYSALHLKFAGSFEVSETFPMQLGAYFKFFLSPRLSESPVSSGSSSNKLNSFGFFGTYRMTQNYSLRGELNFDYFTSDFSGTGSRSPEASSTNSKFNVLAFGIEYLF